MSETIENGIKNFPVSLEFMRYSVTDVDTGQAQLAILEVKHLFT